MSEPTTDPRIDLRPTRIFALLEDERDLGLVLVGAPLGEVVALTASATSRAALLEQALALGATRAVQVVDAAMAEVDYLAVAHVLACAVRHLCEVGSGPPVIVLAGDRGRGAIGPAVAERLALPHLGAVARVEMQQDRILVERHCGQWRRRYRGSPPIVLACILPTAPPAGERGGASVEDLGLDTLQITLPELRYRRRFRPESGPPIPCRALLYGSIERLDERLQRDGIWRRR